MNESLIDKLKERRTATKANAETLSRRMAMATASDARQMQTKFDGFLEEVRAIDERIEELREVEARESAAAASRIGSGGSGSGARFTTNGPETYSDPRQNRDAPSFFADLRNAKLGDYNAAERLSRNAQERGLETRAGDMSTTANQGGQFAPPAWLVQEFVSLARAGRVTADLMQHDTLPPGVSSINLPKVGSGTTTAVQATQNTAVSDTAMVTSSVTSGITTIAGKQIVSCQLLAQSGAPFDRVILADLAADFARQIDQQVISGSGASGQLRGLLNGAGVGVTTFTTATPAVTSATAANSFYNKVVASINAVFVARYMPPTAIVMHPSRWSWILEAIDTATRPLILADGTPAFNGVGTDNGPTAQGATGSLLGLPVYVDANVPVNLGAGTNEDRVIVLRAPDCFLYESELTMSAFEATYADQLSVLFRVHGYSAFIPDRYGPSVNVIAGTGLVAPTL